MLRLAGVSVGVAAFLVGCRSDAPDVAGEDGEADALRALGEELAAGPSGDRLGAAAPPDARSLDDEQAVLALLADLQTEVSADFADGRVVLGAGWLLADTEAAVLVAYAEG